MTPLSPTPSARRTLVAFALVLACALCGASGAAADVGATIIERCTHGQSLSGFSQQAYSQALRELPTEVEEYSDCANLIRRAQLAAAGGGAGPPASVTPLTPAQSTALKSALKSAPRPLQVGGGAISPGVVHVDVASAVSTLPTPLLAILAFMLVCALVLAGGSIRNRIRAKRSN